MRAAAQHPDDEYYPFAQREAERPMIVPDTTLFYRAIQTADDAFGRIADFNMPQVALRRRGCDYGDERIFFAGLEVSYRHAAALRLLGAGEERVAGTEMLPGLTGGAGGMRSFGFGDGEPLTPYLASVRFTDRNYRVGARIAARARLGRGWEGGVAADARTGRDMHAEGVFTRALTAAFRLAKRFGRGCEVALLAVVPPSVRGTRLSSTEEAFTLTGDPLYNPAWGFQNGRVRNSRVRREVLPLAVASCRMPLTASTAFAAALGAEAGIRKYSALGWYDARTPMPDNYRYLPSATGDRETEEAWRGGDARYTQIRWDELIAQNRLAGGEAVYAFEDRVERRTDLQADAGFTTVVDRRLTLFYGLFCRRTGSRNYKQMRDLLGAEYLVDIDRYLVDDDTYDNLLQNDLRHPDRKIGRGGRFAYDYSLLTREAGVRMQAAYRSDRLRADAGFTLGDAVVFRCGHFEKELFPGRLSYGRSRRMRFTPWTLKAAAGWAFSPRRYLALTLTAAAETPDAADLFIQPSYNNRTVDDPKPRKRLAAELTYRLTGPVLDLQVTAFAAATADGMRTQRYFDDLAGVYCDLVVAGIGQGAYGVEAAAEVRLSYRWRLSFAASAGSYRYIRDPRVTVLSDVDNTLIDNRAVSRMGGCATGGAPQFTAVAGVGWFGPKGWGFRVSAGYAGRRFVEPAPLRRTARITGQGGVTPEAFAAFVRQERLRDAATVDASLFKSFYFGRRRLTVAWMLRNLPGGDAVYGGYESLRVRRMTAGDEIFRLPHATRYTHAAPRSFHLSVTFRF